MSFSNDFDDSFTHTPPSTYLELGPAGAKRGDAIFVHVVPSLETLGQTMALTAPTQSTDALKAQVQKIVEDCNAMLLAIETIEKS